jgi:hypothetical protein
VFLQSEAVVKCALIFCLFKSEPKKTSSKKYDCQIELVKLMKERQVMLAAMKRVGRSTHENLAANHRNIK